MNKIVELKNEEIANVVGGVLTASALSTSTTLQSPLSTTTSPTVATSGSFQMWSSTLLIKRY
jgi:hypothetical protein